MSGPRDAILKRLHALTISPRRARSVWAGKYWRDSGPFRDIDCRHCRKFDVSDARCRVGFGSPLRKCSLAAIEAHLNDARGEEVLEIGFGRLATARNLIRRSGGRWTGIDPGQPRERSARLGHGGYGHAADIPFPDASFDRVFGIQTFEHWGQSANARTVPSDYGECLDEVWRVLRPGGLLYLDAPMHFHGHEMFIMGDVGRICGLFEDGRWTGLVVERWRRAFEPLEKYPPSLKVQAEWPLEISSYSPQEVDAVRERASVWLLAIRVRKPA